MTRGQPIRLLVHGAQGRMGSRIVALARHDARFSVAAALDRDDGAQLQRLGAGAYDVLIDFSNDEGAQRAAQAAPRQQAALLVGTTALSRGTLDLLDAAARTVPVMVAANTSLGVAVLNHLAAEAARLLGPQFDIDVIEAHHAGKRDAPSGTALRLVESLRAAAGRDLPAQRVHSIRAGEIAGEHTLQFAGPAERLTITHTATSRDVFALGALRAAAWLQGHAAGRYTIEQSLGLAATEQGQTQPHSA